MSPRPEDTPPASPGIGDDFGEGPDDGLDAEEVLEVIELDDLEGGDEPDEDLGDGDGDDEMDEDGAGASARLAPPKEDNSELVFNKHGSKNLYF